MNDLLLRTASDRFDFFVRKDLVATYRLDGLPGFVALYAPENRAITRRDAPQERALYLAHGEVNGIAFGVETEAAEVGRIVSQETTARRGSHSVGFCQTLDWLAPTGEALLTEERVIRVLRGPAEGAVLDWTSELRPAAETPILFGQTERALLRLHPASALTPAGGGQLRNSRGDYGAEAMHGRAATWCGGIGVINGQTVGFAFLDHPANLWHPNPWLVYPDGTLSPSAFPWRSLDLAPGQSLILRYRLLLHCGYVDQGWADARLAAFAR
jgi:hypothetical protein